MAKNIEATGETTGLRRRRVYVRIRVVYKNTGFVRGPGMIDIDEFQIRADKLWWHISNRQRRCRPVDFSLRVHGCKTPSLDYNFGDSVFIANRVDVQDVFDS